jgi:hypothetical protein
MIISFLGIFFIKLFQNNLNDYLEVILLNDLSKINQAIYLKGVQDGIIIGYSEGHEKGYLTGVKDTLTQVGKEASIKLSKDKDGNPMAFYRYLVKKYNK